MPVTGAPPIPAAILARVAHHIAALHAWNAAITQARMMERIAGQPGRYEYELRATAAGAIVRPAMRRAVLALAALEADALTHGVLPEELYAACGGKPALLPEGAAVGQWGPVLRSRSTQGAYRN